jgi:hypothetical protein
MKKLFFVLLFSQSFFKANASQEVHYQFINPISKTVISQDSVRLADSLQLVDKENKVRLKKKIFLSLGLTLATRWAIKG